MDMVLIILVVVAVLAYYGFMRSVETGARMANSEVEHLADVHQVSLIERTARLEEKISNEKIDKAIEVKSKIKAMKSLKHESQKES